MSGFSGFLGLVGGAVVLVIAVVSAFFVGTIFRPRHRLVWWPLIGERPGDGGAWANVYMIENAGKAHADDIEVRLSLPAARAQLSPAVAHGSRPDAGGRVLTIDCLAAGHRLALRVEARTGEPPRVLEIAWRDGVAEQKPESWRRGGITVP
jgi:hypothetical protein